jgi:hypothetical protein
MAKRMVWCVMMCVLSLAVASAQQEMQKTNDVKPLAMYCQHQYSLDARLPGVRPHNLSVGTLQFRLDPPRNSLRARIEGIRAGDLILGRTLFGGWAKVGFAYHKSVSRYGNNGLSGTWPGSAEPRTGTLMFQIQFPHSGP